MRKIKNRKLLLVSILALIVIASVGAVIFYSLPSQKSGTWGQNIEPTDLEVTSLLNVVLKDKVKTTIIISNPTTEEISANVALYYEPDIANKDFNVTIAAGTEITETLNVKMNETEILSFDEVLVFINEY